jgi:septal ring factor EnvC (AmiA/AmiB activator)
MGNEVARLTSVWRRGRLAGMSKSPSGMILAVVISSLFLSTGCGPKKDDAATLIRYQELRDERDKLKADIEDIRGRISKHRRHLQDMDQSIEKNDDQIEDYLSRINKKITRQIAVELEIEKLKNPK